MNMKKILLISAVAGLALGLAACGKAARLNGGDITSSISSLVAGTSSAGTDIGTSNGTVSGNSSGTNTGLSATTGSSVVATSAGSSAGSSAVVASSSATSTDGAVLAYFSTSGTIDSVYLNSVNQSGTGSQLLNFKDIRDSAAAKNANVATIILTDISVNVDPAYAAALAGYANSTVLVNLYFTNSAGTKTMVASSAVAVSVSTMLSGISMNDNSIYILPTNFATLQSMIAEKNAAGAYVNDGTTITVEMTVKSGTLPDAEIWLDYAIQANAKVNL